ncbi:hypothetical protein [Burkholderia thailandensis]|uniref:hypothetical protein n=1 Tax=Burkholderia thailandensis TaxID=57975 RepID=UPI00358DA97B
MCARFNTFRHASNVVWRIGGSLYTHALAHRAHVARKSAALLMRVTLPPAALPAPVMPDSNASAPFASNAPAQVVCSESSVTDVAITVADFVSTVSDAGATRRTVSPAAHASHGIRFVCRPSSSDSPIDTR